MSHRLSGPARIDLLEIWSYTNREWGQSQADLYVDGLITRFAWLVSRKPIWKKRSDIAPGLHSYHHERHVIMFRETSTGIDILRVLHERMEVARQTGDL